MIKAGGRKKVIPSFGFFSLKFAAVYFGEAPKYNVMG